MIAYDPALKRVYHGNCLYSSFVSEASAYEKENETWSRYFFRKVGIPFHVHYAKFLLSGMVKTVEQKAREGQGSSRENSK